MSNSKNSDGFTLLELIIVIVIVGILTALAIIGLPKVLQAVRNSSQPTRLSKYLDAQVKFKTSLGKRRYATLSELRQLGLIDDTVARFRANQQIPIDDYLLESADEDLEFLRNNFRVRLVKQNRTKQDNDPNYCITADGIIRRGSEGDLTECVDDSPPLK